MERLASRSAIQRSAAKLMRPLEPTSTNLFKLEFTLERRNDLLSVPIPSGHDRLPLSTDTWQFVQALRGLRMARPSCSTCRIQRTNSTAHLWQWIRRQGGRFGG